MLGGVPPMAYRWQKLLEARGIRESLGWLNRAYLVSYTAGQVLPTRRRRRRVTASTRARAAIPGGSVT